MLSPFTALKHVSSTFWKGTQVGRLRIGYLINCQQIVFILPILEHFLKICGIDLFVVAFDEFTSPNRIVECDIVDAILLQEAEYLPGISALKQVEIILIAFTGIIAG